MGGFTKAAVIGHPAAHSKSPLIHAYWIEKYGLNGSYEALDVAPEHLRSGVQGLIDQNYAGFNVTLPHKESILAHCAGLSETARVIGAVNLVTVQGGKLIGDNSDAFGFLGGLRAQLPAFDFKAGPSVVLGAGGATRAVLYALLQEGAPEVVLLNRSREKAEKLARDFSSLGKIRAPDWAARHEHLPDANLLVNTTSLGMAGQPPLDISLEKLRARAAVSDIVYTPLQTPLLREASKRGHPAAEGIGMLLHQARPAFHAWFGVMPEVDEALQRLIEA